MWIDIFPKKTYRWPTGTWKAARCWASPEKCKLKPQRDITSHLSERLSSKRTEITNVDEDVEKRDPLYTVGGNVNWYSHYENNMEVSQKIKNRTRIWPSNPTTGHIPWENHNSKRHMHPNVHCSTIYNSQDMEAT